MNDRKAPVLIVFFEICRTYPISSFLLVIGPFIGAVLTAGSAYQGLKARLSNDQQAVRIVSEVQSLSPRAEMVRTYELNLESRGERSESLKKVTNLYDQTQILIAARLTGKVDTAEKLGAAERALADLELALLSVRTLTLLGSEALVMRIAPNTFSVTASAPISAWPQLTFSGLPNGTVANVLEPSLSGFKVIFTPSDKPVQIFGVSAEPAH